MFLVADPFKFIDLVNDPLRLVSVIRGLERVIVLHRHRHLRSVVLILGKPLCGSRIDLAESLNTELGLNFLVKVVQGLIMFKQRDVDGSGGTLPLPHFLDPLDSTFNLCSLVEVRDLKGQFCIFLFVSTGAAKQPKLLSSETTHLLHHHCYIIIVVRIKLS